MDNQHWNTATNLPSPGIPLIVQLDDGSEVSAIRPEHVASRHGDLGYVANGESVKNVKWWKYE